MPLPRRQAGRPRIGAATSRQRASLAGELVTAYPNFVADPAATMRKAKYPAAVTEKLVGALRDAGLAGAS